MRLDDGKPYLVGIGSGVLAFVLITPILGIPPSFAPFAARSLVVFLGASLAGFYLSARYFERSEV